VMVLVAGNVEPKPRNLGAACDCRTFVVVNKDTFHQHKTRSPFANCPTLVTPCPRPSQQRNASFTNSSTAASAHPLRQQQPHLPDPSHKAQSTNQPPSAFAPAASPHLPPPVYAQRQRQNPQSIQSEEKAILRHGRTMHLSSAYAVLVL
jgi:hypothetical protein